MAVFWDVAPCSLINSDRRFRGTYFLHPMLNTLMMEAVSSSETLVRSTKPRCNIPEDSHFILDAVITSNLSLKEKYHLEDKEYMGG
jgi:hypothetical protein